MALDKKIGIAISGGGHRATIFALGALLYLVDSGRNKSVAAISSVSGGSITNAFIALLPFLCKGKSFHNVDASSFELAAAALAKRIAGSPSWWWSSIASFVVFLAIWIILTIYYFPSHLTLEWQALIILLIFAWAFLIGPRSGGTLWAAWTTWLYVGLMTYSFFMALVLILFQPTSIAGYILLFIPLTSFTARSWISELAMKKAFLSSEDGVQHTDLLRDISNSVRHIFCSTDLYTGRHVFFSHDIVFSPELGIGEPGDLKLSKVIQSSANFPVAFPPMRIPIRNFRFKLSEQKLHQNRQHMVLSDGGIRDNTGVNWFIGAEERCWHLNSLLTERSSEIDPEDMASIQNRIAALGEIPDELIVINSSSPFFFKEPGNMWIPIWGDLRSLLKVPSLLYNNEGIRLAKDLRERFFASERNERGMKGALISIEDSPFFMAEFLSVNVPDSGAANQTEGVLDHWKLSMGTSSPEFDDARRGMSKALSEAHQFIDKSYDTDYPEYPFRKRVSHQIRQRATRVMKWLKNGADYSWYRRELKVEVDRMQRASQEIEEKLSKVRKDIRLVEKVSSTNRYGPKLLRLKVKEAELGHLKAILDNKKRSLTQEDDKYFEKSNDARNKFNFMYMFETLRELDTPQKETSKNVPTTLRPLGRNVTTHLLWHGYLSMIVNGGIFLDYPLPEALPELADFEGLAEGRPRASADRGAE